MPKSAAMVFILPLLEEHASLAILLNASVVAWTIIAHIAINNYPFLFQ
jgi:hypothetical protein